MFVDDCVVDKFNGKNSQKRAGFQQNLKPENDLKFTNHYENLCFFPSLRSLPGSGLFQKLAFEIVHESMMQHGYRICNMMNVLVMLV